MLNRLERRALVPLLLCTSLAVSSCSGPSLPTAADARPRLEQLSTDLAGAFARDYPGQPWLPVRYGDTSMAMDSSGTCVLWIGTLRSQDSLYAVAGNWDAVMKTINAVLKEGGFAPITHTDSFKGGYTGISSTGGHGGRLNMFEKGPMDISVSAKVSGKYCSADL